MKTHTLIMLRIAALFLIAIAFTFIPEQYPHIFGDWQCQGSQYIDKSIVGCRYHVGDAWSEHGPTTHWGYRHFLWFFMGLTLFIYNVVLIVASIHKATDPERS